VTVTRIDRLARSTFDLFAIVKLSPAQKKESTQRRAKGATLQELDSGPRMRKKHKR
jgi:hypothetical protein